MSFLNDLGFRIAFMAAILLSGLLMFLSQRFKSRLLIILNWFAASGIAGVEGSFMLASYSGYEPWGGKPGI